MRAVFESRNLIGDALNISPALRAWCEKFRANDYQKFMLTNDDFISFVYGRMGIKNLKVLRTYSMEEICDESKMDFKFTFDVGKAFEIGEKEGCHISQAFAKMLDVEIETYRPTYEVVEEPHNINMVLIAPFSRSCSVHTTGVPNKTLPWVKWEKIIELLRMFGPIGILGASGDRCPQEMHISEDEYYTGLPLNQVALMLRDCKLFVSVDNGMSHLAASQVARHILLYPKCLSTDWAFPFGNPHALGIHMDPQTIAAGVLLRQIKEFIHKLDVKA